MGTGSRVAGHSSATTGVWTQGSLTNMKVLEALRHPDETKYKIISQQSKPLPEYLDIEQLSQTPWFKWMKKKYPDLKQTLNSTKIVFPYGVLEQRGRYLDEYDQVWMNGPAIENLKEPEIVSSIAHEVIHRADYKKSKKKMEEADKKKDVFDGMWQKGYYEHPSEMNAYSAELGMLTLNYNWTRERAREYLYNRLKMPFGGKRKTLEAAVKMYNAELSKWLDKVMKRVPLQ